jgi:hypothetical protein
VKVNTSLNEVSESRGFFLLQILHDTLDNDTSLDKDLVNRWKFQEVDGWL